MCRCNDRHVASEDSCANAARPNSEPQPYHSRTVRGARRLLAQHQRLNGSASATMSPSAELVSTLLCVSLCVAFYISSNILYVPNGLYMCICACAH
jgi:hypothetical protein